MKKIDAKKTETDPTPKAPKTAERGAVATTTPNPPRTGAKPNARKSAVKRTSMGGLDIAAKILAGAREPLGCAELTRRVIGAGWKTKGKTPAATIHAAIVREIKGKGKASRFRKTGRGLFTATAAK